MDAASLAFSSTVIFSDFSVLKFIFKIDLLAQIKPMSQIMSTSNPSID